MSYSLRIHQSRCRLGLRPRPHWGSLRRSHELPSWLKGVASPQDGIKWDGRTRVGVEGKERGWLKREGTRKRGAKKKGMREKGGGGIAP